MVAQFKNRETAKQMVQKLSVLVGILFAVSLAQAVELEGQYVQGGMVKGKTDRGDIVTLDGRVLDVAPDGYFVFGFDRDAKSRAVLKIKKPDGDVIEREIVVQPRQYDIQRIDGIPPKIMSPSKENLQRIGEEATLVRKARARREQREDFAGPFVWPLTGPITGVYGSQRVYNGEPKRPHYGVDVAAPIGTPVSTPAPGIVTVAHPDMFYSGGTLIIDHGYGISSTLMHLSKVLVKVGDEVKPGDVVAEVGAGGRATGAHLDWRMNWFDARIDPQLLVKPMPPQPPKK